jgi:hypothetical protein
LPLLSSSVATGMAANFNSVLGGPLTFDLDRRSIVRCPKKQQYRSKPTLPYPVDERFRIERCGLAGSVL